MPDDPDQIIPIIPIPAEILCFEIPNIDLCKALLPGSIEFQDPDLLRLLQPALAPLVPLFNILEAVVAIKNCIEAIPAALGPPPDPRPIIDCIPTLAEKIQKLLGLLPQVSVPTLVANIIDCIISELRKLRSFIAGLQAQLQRIATIIDKAAELEDPNLQLIAACANERLASTLDDKMKALIVLGRLLGLIKLFMEIAGLPADKVPTFESIATAPLAEVLEPIDAMLDILITIRRTVLAVIPETPSVEV